MKTLWVFFLIEMDSQWPVAIVLDNNSRTFLNCSPVLFKSTLKTKARGKDRAEKCSHCQLRKAMDRMLSA